MALNACLALINECHEYILRSVLMHEEEYVEYTQEPDLVIQSTL